MTSFSECILLRLHIVCSQVGSQQHERTDQTCSMSTVHAQCHGVRCVVLPAPINHCLNALWPFMATILHLLKVTSNMNMLHFTEQNGPQDGLMNMTKIHIISKYQWPGSSGSHEWQCSNYAFHNVWKMLWIMSFSFPFSILHTPSSTSSSKFKLSRKTCFIHEQTLRCFLWMSFCLWVLPVVWLYSSLFTVLRLLFKLYQVFDSVQFSLICIAKITTVTSKCFLL